MTDLVRLAAALPVGDRNGLDALAADVTDDPTGMHVVIAIVDCKQTVHKIESGETIATLRLRRIEALFGLEANEGRELLRRAMERRTGREALPSDVESELEEIDAGGDRR